MKKTVRNTKRKSSSTHKAKSKIVAGSGGRRDARKFSWKRALILIVAVGLLGGYFVYRSSAASLYNLKSYFPNTSRYTTQYLEGNNYEQHPPSRSVLWFEKQDPWTYRMYNSAPQNSDRRCNYDVLSWWNDKTLRYSETDNSCAGSTANKIVYDAPIIFLPAVWNNARPWTVRGRSVAKYYEADGKGIFELKCTGTITYVGRILGIENVTVNEPAIHWQTTQKTMWTEGSAAGKCSQGYTTNWQEDYWLSAKLKTPAGNYARGLRRSKGGNKDITSGNWDVWYDGWSQLPQTLNTP